MRPKRPGADNGDLDFDDIPSEVSEDENNMLDNGTNSGKPLPEENKDGMKDAGGERTTGDNYVVND